MQYKSIHFCFSYDSDVLCSEHIGRKCLSTETSKPSFHIFAYSDQQKLIQTMWYRNSISVNLSIIKPYSTVQFKLYCIQYPGSLEKRACGNISARLYYVASCTQACKKHCTFQWVALMFNPPWNRWMWIWQHLITSVVVIIKS